MAVLLAGGSAFARDEAPSVRMIEPIVSTDWLDKSRGQRDLVMIDVRSPVAYGAGHIPGSISEPFVTGFLPETGPTSHWIVGRGGLWLEIPDTGDLFGTIGHLGISADSRVVVVTDPDPGDPAPQYGLCSATRVATTLIYAGVGNVAILDGGYAKWVAEGKETTKDVPVVSPVTFKGKADEAIFVSVEYVRQNMRKASIIDARDAGVYFGVIIEPYAAKAGHIPEAASLPAPWIWDLKGGAYTYKDPETLRAMASGVIREPKGHERHWDQEIIVHCGVGGYASSWWFVLTQVLGYENVKFYDGSSQEWAMYYDMVPYQWD